ncbi:ATP-binding protein [Nocardioides sp. ChNu-153]|uniref:ATP-binding protein n=1 Tax=unclassified Nocardioides TaxID=2615069 RepID=UPI0024074B59|nr:MULTISPECIES: ATP-binding protein [unclassified Nocardioides]MDF9714688.1 ATP-binding protein [Nocardioides sp. ChNu-99]MDN7119779.1 ATP-binding protein [Nocardioides sp. ChNu-153]
MTAPPVDTGAPRGDSSADLTVFDAELPFTERTTYWARVLLRNQLHAHEARRSLVENATLIIHELVSNCMDHGYPCPNETLKVGWRLSPEALELHVTDCGPDPRCPQCHPGGAAGSTHTDGGRGPRIVPRDAAYDEQRGRGLLLVDALSDHWEVESTESSTTVRVSISRA